MSFKGPAVAKQIHQGSGRSKNQENMYVQPGATVDEKTLLKNNPNGQHFDRTNNGIEATGVANPAAASGGIDNNPTHILLKKIGVLEEQNRKQASANEVIYRKLLATEAELSRRSQDGNLGSSSSSSAAGLSWKNVPQSSDLNNRYHELALGHNTFLDNVRSHAFTVQQQLDSKDEEIARLRGLLDTRTDKLKVASITQERNFDRCNDLDREIIELQQANARLLAQLDQAKYDLEVSNLTHKAEGTRFVEVEHLRADVQRLLQMLKNTEEYKDFSDYSDDSSQSIRFLKDIRARTYVDNKCNSTCKLIRPCMCVSATEERHWVEDEKLLWVPEEAFKFAHAFRLKYRGELTDTLIENLLFELNKIWSKREQRLITRVKSSTSAEVAGLRRQLASNPTYDEHQAKATIARLQAQLKNAFKENREAFGNRERRNPPGSHYVKETMKENQAKQRAERRQSEKFHTLRNKVASMELNKFHDQAEKAIFMEGAQWMNSRILSEIDHLHAGINGHARTFQQPDRYQDDQTSPHQNQFANSNYNNTFNNNNNLSTTLDANSLMRKADWFVDNVDGELAGFKNRIKQLNRNSEKDMIEAAVAMKASLRPQSKIMSSF